MCAHACAAYIACACNHLDIVQSRIPADSFCVISQSLTPKRSCHSEF